MEEFLELASGDRTVTFLKFKAYMAKLFVNKTCKVPYSNINECILQVEITPKRQTSMKHLKDGLCNGLSKQSQEMPFDSDALIGFKGLFPSGTMDEKESILFTKDKDTLCASINGKETGCIRNKWLARAFMNLYFDERNTVVCDVQQEAKINYESFISRT